MKRTFSRAVSVVVLATVIVGYGGLSVVTFAAEESGESPFVLNGWQLHDYNMPKLREAIEKAPHYGVNFLILSHDIFRTVEGFLASGDDFDPDEVRKMPSLDKLYSGSHTKPHPLWQRNVQELGTLADREGLDWYLWIHELDDLPPRFIEGGRANLDDPDLLTFLDRRYEKLLEVLPGAAGFVLTFHESNYKIFRDSEVRSKLNRSDRIYLLTKLIYDVAHRHDKKLILRNFLYEPMEMEMFSQAIERLPDDLIIMSKTTFHEFDPFYPPDSMHGKVGRKAQIIEIDLGVEKALSNQGAYAQTEYIRRFANRARKRGLAGMVGRCRLKWDHSFKDPHEINQYAFSRFMRDPDLSVDTVLEDWARRRYPNAPQAARHIASAMKRTQFINHNGRYHLGCWLTKSIGEQWGNYRYYFGHLLQRARSKWSGDPEDKAIEDKLYNPDIETYNKLVAEKEEVLRQVRESMSDLDLAGIYLTAEQIEPLREDFHFLEDATRLELEWARAYFAQRLYMGEPREEYRVMVENALRNLESIERTPGVTYGLNLDTGRRYNIDAFVLEMRWRMKNRSRARDEDESILKRVRHKIDVQAN